MSIILDALKKAEKDRTRSENSPLETQKNQGEDSPKVKKNSPLITIVLVIVGFGAIGYLSYKYFFKPPLSPGNPKPIVHESKSEKNDNTLVTYEAAHRLFLQGNYSLAQKKWEESLAKNPNLPETHNNLGLLYKKQGKADLALSSYEKAIELKPDYPEALNNIGALYLESNQLHKAKESLLKAIKSDPQYADPIFHLAIIYDREGNKKEALDKYASFLSLKEGIDATLKGHVEMRMALIEASLNRIR